MLEHSLLKFISTRPDHIILRVHTYNQEFIILELGGECLTLDMPCTNTLRTCAMFNPRGQPLLELSLSLLVKFEM